RSASTGVPPQATRTEDTGLPARPSRAPRSASRTSSTRIRRRALPAIVREGLVRLRHAEDVVLPLVRAALLGLGVGQLAGEPLRHRLLAAGASELDQPANRQRAGAALRDLDR